MTHTDLTFFTNQNEATLLDRFNLTLKQVQYFDVLVGYFRTSGFHLLKDAFEGIEKIRILVGMNVDRHSYEIYDDFRNGQLEFDFQSHKQTKDIFEDQVITEMEHSADSAEIEDGIHKFMEFLQSGKIEMRAHPSHSLHAKVYISRYPEGDRDYGRVITGSSNFSKPGLMDRYEFNVELKNSQDVKYALEQFESLWAESVELNQTYTDVVNKKTWLNDQITPYELYLKFLYEYFKEDINQDQEDMFNLPQGFLDLGYQKQAVLSAKKVLDAYGGVFLADVVGLGKTYIAALLAQQLPGKKLIICPPVLVEYWKETFFQFGIGGFTVESLGKLDHLLKHHDKYDYIFVDEAHRFRNEITQGYEKLHQICFGKKVILVTATPLNNTIEDIYSQLKLFMKPKQSLIPGMPNLEKFFDEKRRYLKEFDKGTPEYAGAFKAVSRQIRDQILKYVMVRRTRSEITRFFTEDLKQQGLTFPTIEDPHRIIYQFDSKTEQVFEQTITLLQSFCYSRYTPLLFLRQEVSEFEKQSQRNVGGFMKGILVKRLESSFFAFRRSLERFIHSYEGFIKMYEDGTIFISKDINIVEYLDADNVDELLRLAEEDKVQKYVTADFRPEYGDLLRNDLVVLKEIQKLWMLINRDPKLEQFIQDLKSNKVLKKQKVVVFTESAETGQYLFEALEKEFAGKVIFYSSQNCRYDGQSVGKRVAREMIQENFDPNSTEKRDDLQVLITTDVLSEGINLHRSNIVVNYDLPWNPTRVLQRCGRVNRVGTEHAKVHIFNFFPTDQSNDEIGLEENIKAKIQAFHDMLGEDAKYLTEEEDVGSFKLFGDSLYRRLTNKTTYEGPEEEERSELEFLAEIRAIRDQQPDLFEKIKRLPKKARSARCLNLEVESVLLTFFRLGSLKKFYLADQSAANEVDFFTAVDLMRCDSTEPRQKMDKQIYTLLESNVTAFNEALVAIEDDQKIKGGGLSNEKYLLSRLKAKEVRYCQAFTDDDEEFIRLLIDALNDGIVPKGTTKRLRKEIEKEIDPRRMLSILRKEIPENLLYQNGKDQPLHQNRREVILSEWFVKGY